MAQNREWGDDGERWLKAALAQAGGLHPSHTPVALQPPTPWTMFGLCPCCGSGHHETPGNS